MDLPIPLRKLHPNAQLPTRGTPLAAGWDLHAVDAHTLAPGAWAAIPTGLAIALPQGYEMQIRPRSGLAARHAVTVLNAPGTIDADYRGELKILLINHGPQPFDIAPGDRIAQAVVAQHATLDFQLVEALPESQRGTGGFGHTGKR